MSEVFATFPNQRACAAREGATRRHRITCIDSEVEDDKLDLIGIDHKNGVETARQARDRRPAIPVLFASAHTDLARLL